MNKVSLVGNLTKDAEFPSTSDGKTFMTLRIAVNHRTKEGKEETLYMDVTCFGYLAEYGQGVGLSKGDRVVVEGRLQDRTWVDNNQNKRSSMCVLASHLYKCETISKM